MSRGASSAQVSDAERREPGAPRQRGCFESFPGTPVPLSVSNRKGMNLKRRKGLLVLAVLVAIASVAFATLRIRHYLVCIRAQRLLDTMQHLELGSTRACEIFRDAQKDWGSHVSSLGNCTDPKAFSMNVEVADPAYIPPFCGEHQSTETQRWLASGACGTYELFSGPPIVLRARVEAARGVVTRKWSVVYTVVPDDAPDEDLPAILRASADAPEQLDKYSGERRRLWRGRDFQSDVRQEGLHPSYRVFVNTGRVNQDTGGGPRAPYIQVDMGPDASKSDSERLLQFDLSCLRWLRPCTQRDLLPAAYGQYEADLKAHVPPQ